MKEVRILEDARLEVSAAFKHYLEISNSRARDFLTHYTRAIAYISQYPKAGTATGSLFRRFVLSRRYKYILIYREYETYLLLIAFAHQKRKPGYWIRRLKTITES